MYNLTKTVKYVNKNKLTQHVIKCIQKGTFTPIIPVAKILTELLNQKFTIYDYTGTKEEKLEILPPKNNNIAAVIASEHN